jgi:hypothetical protein
MQDYGVSTQVPNRLGLEIRKGILIWNSNHTTLIIQTRLANYMLRYSLNIVAATVTLVVS